MAKIDVNKINSWPHLRAAFRKLLSTYDTEYFGGYSGTYKEIKKLRDNGSLIPGNKYRIIDYETIIGDIDNDSYSGFRLSNILVDSAKYPFDLILTANTKNEFSHNAEATHSARDKNGIFTDRDLSKWQIWYDIDSGSGKYDWVDDSCKGVIYRMINENNVDCPYDFESITFNGDFTFSYEDNDGIRHNATRRTVNCHIKQYKTVDYYKLCCNRFIVKLDASHYYISNIYLGEGCNFNTIYGVRNIDNIIFGERCTNNNIEYQTDIIVNIRLGCMCVDNSFVNAHNILLEDSCSYNSLTNVDKIIIRKRGTYISLYMVEDCNIGAYCSNISIIFATLCTIGNNCYDINFGRTNELSSNVCIGNNCHSIEKLDTDIAIINSTFKDNVQNFIQYSLMRGCIVELSNYTADTVSEYKHFKYNLTEVANDPT